jgi:hypothetical protein
VGDDPSLMHRLIHSVPLVMLVCTLTAQQTARKTGKNTMPKTAQDYIAAFERGEDFAPPATGLIVNGEPDGAALEILGRELAAASPSVREEIVALLVDIGRRTDPLTPKGADVLRHAGIVALLAGPGLAKADLGREAAMDALRKLVTQPVLAGSGDAFIKALKDRPTEEAFLLIAKAKPGNAKELVDRLAGFPEWKNVEAAKIVRAALGSKDIEDEFLATAANAEAASNGKALSNVLGTLALVGTPRSLKAIAERLRTPLTILVPGAFEKSVRLSVLEALLYNFPDQPVLYPNNIIREADYTAAENFCAKTFGVTYSTPPPPFMTYRGFPFP